MSSPCAARQVCRNLPNSEYVCQQELDPTENFASLPSQMTENKQEVWANLQKIWKNVRHSNGNKNLAFLRLVEPLEVMSLDG